MKGDIAVEADWQALLYGISDTLLLVSEDGLIRWTNGKSDMLGYTEKALLNQSVNILLPESLRTRHTDWLKGYFKNPSQRMMADGRQFRARTHQGNIIEVNIELTPITFEGALHVLVTLRESHQDTYLHNKLLHAERLLKDSQAIAKLGTWDWDISDGSLQWSDQIYTMFGISKQDFGASYDAFLQFVHPDDRHKLEAAVEAAMEKDRPYAVNHRIIRADGTIRHIAERARLYRDGNGTPVRMLGTAQDITDDYLQKQQLEQANQQIHQHQQQLQQLAYYDGLTGLPNRNFFIKHLDERIAAADSPAKPFALLYLDIDGFKEINDSQGHDEGDNILQELAKRIIGIIPDDTLVARLGGDEFAVLLDDDIDASAERILSELKLQKHYGNFSVRLSASLGIALYPQDGDTALELLKKADIAMYAAKKYGKSTIRHYDPAIAARQVDRLQRISDLEKAVAEQQFEVHYQPKLSTRRSHALHVEALVRWHHPSEGYIAPTAFISIAEETGMIVDIGDQVLTAACKLIANQRKSGAPALRVAVNLSVQQLYDANLLKRFEDILSRHGVHASELEFEVTESAFINNVDAAKGVLSALKSAGASIAVDDFGTGYSSLSYLAKLPIDTVKIDRAFVQGVPSDSDNATLCKAIASLAHSLRMSVVAEGVETKQQASFLSGLDCDQLQGYYFAKPMCESDLLDYVNSGDWQQVTLD
ncbi:EAL domain-containing protein [Aestuariibacter halophilus]|uniref:EAL domain-containing protein n=1 Tax=Fluctibacter halophilus TaxID=226011 RepID=A0ABS8G7N3_9ALTE|nr:GGDEF and EAL domain-containing protein [Aestuariibacter halophilus]MCC2616538.1 EAL domain-containing protein [Aestuariibacter halophilus]